MQSLYIAFDTISLVSSIFLFSKDLATCPLGGNSSPSSGLEFEVSFCCCRSQFQRKAPSDANVWTIASALLGDLQISYQCFDMDPHRNDFVPDNALIDEDTVVNRTYKTPVIMEFIIY